MNFETKKKSKLFNLFSKFNKSLYLKKCVLFIILIIWIIKISDFAFETQYRPFFFYKLIQHTVTSDTQQFNIKKFSPLC